MVAGNQTNLGRCDLHGRPSVFDISEGLSQLSPALIAPKTKPENLCAVSQPPLSCKSMITKTAGSFASPVQPANTMTFSRHRAGEATLSVLRDLKEEGAVTHSVLNGDGVESHGILTRLPESIRSITKSTLLGPVDGTNTSTIRLILNKAAETRYTVEDREHTILPALLERTKSSIPIFTQTCYADDEEHDSVNEATSDACSLRPLRSPKRRCVKRICN